LSTSHPMLITTADNPLLNQEILNEFISGAEAGACDIAAGLCPRAQVEKARNPGRRTFLKFRDGAYSGCNLFAVRTGQATGAIRFWQDVEADRKHPWRIARKIGLWPLALYAIGQLSRRRLEDTLGRRTGCKARLIDIHHPLAAHDVDKVSDLEFAERVLNNRREQ
ncbi:MAG: GTP--adenosylcobinamide-phosphate guanylyltransferase, partial [Pseudomonadota bacterium]